MSPLWRDELRVGLCPDRLVLARRRRGLRTRVEREIVHAADPLSALREKAKGCDVSVVLSNHLVRYAILSGSAALKSRRDWEAFAVHSFASTYGNESGAWRVQVSATDKPDVRVACAMDGDLLETLRTLPRIASIRPYLMAVFNRCRQTLNAASSWLVVQEPGRIALALIHAGAWHSVRVRQVNWDWPGALARLVEREAAAADLPACDQVLVYSEEAPVAQAGRYRVTDISLPALRPHLMTLH